MKDLIAAIRTSLHRKGISGLSSEEIQTAILELGKGDDLGVEDKKTVVANLVAKYSKPAVIELPTTVEVIPVESNDEQLNSVPEISNETPVNQEPDFGSLIPPVESGKLVTHEQKQAGMVHAEAGKLGITLTEDQVLEVLENATSQEGFESQQVAFIQEALNFYIESNHHQRNNEFTQVMIQATEKSNILSTQFNQRVVGDLTNFFREERAINASASQKLAEALKRRASYTNSKG